MGRLQDKVVLVSGGAGGIGRATVQAMLEEGAKVCVADVVEGRPVVDSPPNTLRVRLDVRSGSDWLAAVGRVEDAFGSLTTLVNAAGVLGRETLEDTSEELYRRVVEVNQMGTFLGMKHCLDSLRTTGNASIINLSSTAGVAGPLGTFSYTASKWAVRGMTKSAASELGHFGIRVNSVIPGPIRTEMMAGIGDADYAFLPAGRVAEPSEVAKLIVFLASDDSGFITGGDYAVDGGMSALLPRAGSIVK